jgi:Rod binding domain-containing protein
MQATLTGTSAPTGQGEENGTALSPRLVRAAHEFEGQMMKELLKPMTSGDALTGTEEDADSGAGSGGALGEFASEALGQSLSERGGFGIADRIIKDLSHSGNQPASGEVTKNQHEEHGMRASE